MTLRLASDQPKGFTNSTTRASRKREQPRDDDDAPLTEDEKKELKVATYCRKLLTHAVRAREPYETFDDNWDAYIGNLWPTNMPSWKAKITINKIRAFIHFMQAVMTDNKPRISVHPVLPGTEDAADLLSSLVDRHWDESGMQNINALAALYGLIWGTGITKNWYDPKANGGRGKHMDVAIPPYRVWVNWGCKTIEDARYLIYIEPQPLGWVYDNFPEKALAVKKYRGSKIREGEGGHEGRDYINEGQRVPNREQIISPLNMSGAQPLMPRDSLTNVLYEDDQETIDVAEFWFYDESEEVYERIKYHGKEPVTEDAADDDGLPVLTHAGNVTQISPVDGLPFTMPTFRPQKRFIMEKALRKKYPNGRVVIMAGPVVLCDIPNPYQIDGFPFSSWKDQDVGAFWGQGEPPQLKQMNIGINRVVAQMYDNINLTGNTSYLVQKDSGLNYRTWKNKPGSLLPVDDTKSAVQKVEQGTVPQITVEFVALLKAGMAEVAGMNDAVMGAAPPANTAFATIDQLQETGAAPTRQKVRNFEEMLKRQGKIRVQLIQQFDRGDRPVRIERTANDPGPWSPVYEHDENGDESKLIAVVPPAENVEVQFRTYDPQDLQGQVEFAIVPDSSLSTSPVGTYNRFMDMLKNGLIDPISWHEQFRVKNYRMIIKRLLAKQAAQMAGGGKSGPKPKQKRAESPRPPTPASHIPTPAQNAIMR